MKKTTWFERLRWRLEDLGSAVLGVAMIATPITVGLLWIACVVGMPILVAISLIKWILT